MGVHRNRTQKSSRKWIFVLGLALCSAVYLFHAEYADAVCGCCSHNKGVCQCQRCDGTSLCENCRLRLSRRAGAVQQKNPLSRQKSAVPKSFTATVLRAVDGDTIIVKVDKQANENSNATSKTIRLADIDCPETNQPFGAEATAYTHLLTKQQSVHVNVRAIDRYDRTVADVTLKSGLSLNAALLNAGLAWWYRDYSKNKNLESLEKEAQAANRGLWSQRDPIPPWVFRRNQRQKK